MRCVAQRGAVTEGEVRLPRRGHAGGLVRVRVRGRRDTRADVATVLRAEGQRGGEWGAGGEKRC